MHDYEMIEAVALSGQMAESQLVALIEADRDFAAWWMERSARRNPAEDKHERLWSEAQFKAPSR